MTEETIISTEETDQGQVYELGYHVLPTVMTDELETEVSKIRQEIEKNEGVFLTEGTPESISLAYPMFVNNGGKKTKYETAYFGWIKFEMEAASAVVLQEEMKANPQILRFILVKTTREETRAQLQTEQHTILREVKTNTTLEKKEVLEEGGEVSEEEIDKSIDELVGEEGKDTTVSEKMTENDNTDASTGDEMTEEEVKNEDTEEQKEEKSE